MQRPMMIQQERQHFSSNRAAITNTVAGLYDLEETLGSGHFAVVKLARHVFTGEKVAVKVIDKTKLDEVSKAHLFQEVRCMKLVQHPHVVRLYEVIDTQTKLYLILELGDGGDLYDYIMRHESGLSESLAREYFRQIVRAISYCHQLHVVHRDLKPENVVFFEKLGVVKLTDFGFSNKFCPGQKLETSCGSLAYSAPEILLGDSYDAPAVDVWSLGVILYMLVCGQPPFQEANDSETLTMIMDCKYTMPVHVSTGCRKLISSMLVREPEKRATLQQIANDTWLQQGNNNQQPEYLPLVSKEQVSDEDHAFIVQKMVNGNIAQKDEILEALDRNEYNHITATYFLLAERRLKAHQQEHQMKKKDLSLPLLTSPGAKNQCHVDDDDKQDSNLLVVPIASMPRTPGGETCQKGRNRKCSIVQEEEDDIGDEGEPSSPLNRRGSRSEGRINLTVQDRLAAEVAERLKKQEQQCQQSCARVAANNESDLTSKVVTKGLIEGIANVKLIKNDNNNEKFLGQAGGGNRGKEIRSGSVDHKMRPGRLLSGQGDVKILTDSSTIPAISISSAFANQIPGKPFKTMPSPTRTVPAPSTASNILKEIFEEGDAGSSDNSNTNTPRPIIRSTNTTSTGPSSSTTATSHHHRRTKFHKSRTTSCSSSDASDDDNSDKKRGAAATVANKMVDSAIKKQFNFQRRDSDSSDSQDPGTGCSGGNNAGSSLILRNGASSTNTGGSGKSSNTSNVQGSGGNGGKNASTTSTSEIGYRRHRAGRRRQTETRLRESQSLNRITEVQECEHNSNIVALSNASNDKNQCNNEDDETVTKNDDDETDSQVSTMNQLNLVTSSTCDAIHNATNELKANKNQNNNKAKGFSARFLQNLNFKRNHGGSEAKNHKSNRNSMSDVPLLKLSTGKVNNHLRPPNNAQMPSDGSDRSKKIKILGRYFQVHKKICQPLSGLFRSSGNANLYKAQSCSSIVRDGIHHHTINNSTLSTSSSSVAKHSTTATTPAKFDEKMLNEREYLIKNCLGSFVGSDGDLNEKSLDKQQQLLEYIDDDLLSGSKC